MVDAVSIVVVRNVVMRNVVMRKKLKFWTKEFSLRS